MKTKLQCNQKLRTKVHMHDPTKFPNIYFSKKKAQWNFCSFRFKVSIHEVFHQHIFCFVGFTVFSMICFTPSNVAVLQNILRLFPFSSFITNGSS